MEIKLSCTNRPTGYKILSEEPLPWDDNGVMHWYLGNTSDDMPDHVITTVMNWVYGHYSHELHPHRIIQTLKEENAEIKVFFVNEDDVVYTRDGKKAFECPFKFKHNPNTLAVHYSCLEGYEYSLHCFINDKFMWNVYHTTGSYDLTKVMIHEAGHGFGLDHTDRKDDIMAAVYAPNNTFTDDSRSGLAHLHGSTRADLMVKNPASRMALILIGRDPDDPSQEVPTRVRPLSSPVEHSGPWGNATRAGIILVLVSILVYTLIVTLICLS